MTQVIQLKERNTPNGTFRDSISVGRTEDGLVRVEITTNRIGKRISFNTTVATMTVGEACKLMEALTTATFADTGPGSAKRGEFSW